MSKVFTNDISPAFQLEIVTVQALCKIVDTPRALTIYLLIEAGEWEQLVSIGIDANDYQEVGNFADDYLVTSVMSKSPNLPLGIDRKAVALDAFFSAEHQCRASNDRILSVCEPYWARHFRKNVRKMMGPLDTPTLDLLGQAWRVGPGATTGVRGVGSVRSDKFDLPLHLTMGLYPFFRSLIGENWWKHQSACKTITEGNKFTTVPKNAKTERGICVEPTLNMSFQLGIGKYLSARLKRFRIDLTSQRQNREFAARAHRDGLATIDIAQASDSLCWGVILKYFPSRWADLIFLGRSEKTKLPDGSWVELEKLSSMGNGYTFELESLVFSALAFSIVPAKEHHDITVFGDDIIIPRDYYDDFVDALNFLGFRVNGSKSFRAGNFFESCGSDYFKGFNVRPFHLHGQKDKIPYALQIANALRIYARRRGGDQYCDVRFRSLWRYLKQRVPLDWRRCTVPDFFGDSGLIVTKEEAGHLPKAKGYHRGQMVRHVLIRSEHDRKTSYGVLLSSLAVIERVDEMGWDKFSGPLYEGQLKGLDAVTQKFLTDVRLGRFSYGREAVRGYLRKPVTRQAVIFDWPDGYHWM